MSQFHKPSCPDCDHPELLPSRREFLKSAGTLAAVAAAGTPLVGTSGRIDRLGTVIAPRNHRQVALRYAQRSTRKTICFAWDYRPPARACSAPRVSNNWHVTKPHHQRFLHQGPAGHSLRRLQGDRPSRVARNLSTQLKDDAGGFGEDQSFAIFGQPGDKFEFVMTGRHMTLRADGKSTACRLRRPDLSRSCPNRIQRKGKPPRQRLLASGQAANKVYAILNGHSRTRRL